MAQQLLIHPSLHSVLAITKCLRWLKGVSQQPCTLMACIATCTEAIESVSSHQPYLFTSSKLAQTASLEPSLRFMSTKQFALFAPSTCTVETLFEPSSDTSVVIVLTQKSILRRYHELFPAGGVAVRGSQGRVSFFTSGNSGEGGASDAKPSRTPIHRGSRLLPVCCAAPAILHWRR